MEILKQFAIREVAGDYLLVPLGRSALDLNGMITLNDVAAEIWNMLPAAENEEMIVQKLLEQYEATEEELRADVKAFLDKLRALGIVK